MRKPALAISVALLVSLIPLGGASAGAATRGGGGATAAAKKKCKKGYVLTTVKKKKRVKGKLRTVKIKKCVKKKRKAPAGSTVYRGQATGTDPKFKYGPVQIQRRGNALKRVEIAAVTTSGCGGFMSLVFTPDLKILGGGPAISGDRVHVVYKPLGDIELITTLDIVFGGSKASGTFRSEGICSNAGLFSTSL